MVLSMRPLLAYTKRTGWLLGPEGVPNKYIVEILCIYYTYISLAR